MNRSNVVVFLIGYYRSACSCGYNQSSHTTVDYICEQFCGLRKQFISSSTFSSKEREEKQKDLNENHSDEGLINRLVGG